MGAYFSSVETEATKDLKQAYGWVKDEVDERDWWHIFHERDQTPERVNLVEGCGAVLDQSKLGSCTANAISGAYEFDERKEGETSVFTPSRLFIYYNERDLEGSIDTDSGASLRDGIKAIAKIGVCPENGAVSAGAWPYDITKFKETPPKSCYQIAQYHRAVEYRRVTQTASQLKRCLANGFPFVFGFVVYESFESDEMKESGVMSMPEQDEKVLGGHAVMAIGYDDELDAFLVRNSWGDQWGQKGNFWMPYDYMLNPELASDFWTVKRVVDDKAK